MVSHDIHGLRPPRGQHGDPIPLSLSLSPRLFDLRNGEFEYLGKRDSCIFYSLSVCRRRGRRVGWGGGLVVAACCRTTRGFPFKRIIDESTYEIQRCLPTWERWKISSKISTERSTLWRNFNSNHPFTRDNCIIFFPSPFFPEESINERRV